MKNKTLVVDNFKGSMTNYINGDINSGHAYITNTFGNNPLVDGKYGPLTWVQTGEQIDEAGSVLTDLIMAAKERVESGILYVYAIGHTGRLYKIQVNDPTTFNPDYDNPVLLATITSNTPTFTRGGFIDFFGATERIYIGHDKGLTRVDFDGTNETFVGILGSWTQNVPRPIQQFIGKMYIGNGSNFAEVDSTATVVSYAKITPGFPTNSQVRDLDVSVDGTYLDAVVSRLALPNILSTGSDPSLTASSDSFIFRWNGTDAGYTSFTTFPSFSLAANIMFADSQYTFGTDQFGMAIFNPIKKILTVTEEFTPMPNAIASSGNLVTWMAPLFYIDHMELTYGVWGSMDFELSGYWSTFGQLPTGTETDCILCPMQLPVSNFGRGSSSNGYADNIYGSAKIYYSSLETSPAPTTKYKLYKWSPGSDNQSAPLDGAIYQTQTQLFSEKIKVSEVRVYGEPWVANNAFTIDLIGSQGFDAVPIANGSKSFVAGTNLTIGDDFAWYTPDIAPTYALGLLITNNGTVNHVINKIEIDIYPAGK